MTASSEKYLKYIETLNKIGIALSAEKNHRHLLEMILTNAMDITGADGGAIYLLVKSIADKNARLNFELIASKSLKIDAKSPISSDFPIAFIPLYLDNQPNYSNVASYCVHQSKTINIEDAYNADHFDFSGAHKIDKQLAYHSKSFLTIPLRNHENKIIGVLQLINALDENTGELIAFSPEKVQLAESLASQAAIALTKQELILAQKNLFEALLQLIAKTIDEKSKHTSNHCERVPILTLMIAQAANNIQSGPFKNFHLSKEQFDELMIAAWLHDCGKLATPEHVMNKSTKLETVFDRIEVIDQRFEILKRDMKITLLENALAINNSNKRQALEDQWQDSLALLNQEQAFISHCNHGTEFLSAEDKKKIHDIATKYAYFTGTIKQPLLSNEEVMNLCVSRGTLNNEEREIIKNHVSVTQKMLQALPYPEYLKNVPEIAGNHHERVDGKGYPKGLTGEKMSVQARIVAIADIFEALTSADRPYKKAKSLKEVLSIMTEMKDNGHIDANLYDLFVQEKIYLNYAKQYLSSAQIDLS